MKQKKVPRHSRFATLTAISADKSYKEILSFSFTSISKKQIKLMYYPLVPYTKQ